MMNVLLSFLLVWGVKALDMLCQQRGCICMFSYEYHGLVRFSPGMRVLPGWPLREESVTQGLRMLMCSSSESENRRRFTVPSGKLDETLKLWYDVMFGMGWKNWERKAFHWLKVTRNFPLESWMSCGIFSRNTFQLHRQFLLGLKLKNGKTAYWSSQNDSQVRTLYVQLAWKRVQCFPVSTLHRRYCTLALFLFWATQLSACMYTDFSPWPYWAK